MIKKEKTKKREKKNSEAKNNEKGNEEAPRGFFNGFNGLHVELKLITKDIIRGQLQTNSYNKYDVQITNSEGSFLIPKGAIAYIKHSA